jgi:hypothetical protein
MPKTEQSLSFFYVKAFDEELLLAAKPNRKDKTLCQ